MRVDVPHLDHPVVYPHNLLLVLAVLNYVVEKVIKLKLSMDLPLLQVQDLHHLLRRHQHHLLVLILDYQQFRKYTIYQIRENVLTATLLVPHSHQLSWRNVDYLVLRCYPRVLSRWLQKIFRTIHF